MEHGRGNLILSVRTVFSNGRGWWSYLFICLVVGQDNLSDAYHRLSAGQPLGWSFTISTLFFLSALLVFLWPRQVRIYDRGILFSDVDHFRLWPRFVPWSEVLLWSWHGRTLRLLLADPKKRASADIPLRAVDRAQVDRVLGSKIDRDRSRAVSILGLN
jgi:hypothetical protein